MSKSKNQHYIPRVYLKQFQIDTHHNKSHVYCINLSDEYNKQVQRLGLRSKVFIEEFYYNDDRLNDPFAIEDLLAQDFEPLYQDIINSITLESNIPEKIRIAIIQWVMISQLRSPYLRVNAKRILKHFWKINPELRGRKFDQKELALVEEYIHIKSKDIHLSTFIDLQKLESISNIFCDNMVQKHWRILKSSDEVPYLTNDNPGFSPNLHPAISKFEPYHSITEMNKESIIYYVLSPKYCLQLIPFHILESVPAPEVNGMKIQFIETHPKVIDWINYGICATAYKLLISNSKELLSRYAEQIAV